MRGGGGGDGAIACSRQGEAEDDHDVHHSRMGAAQATLVLKMSCQRDTRLIQDNGRLDGLEVESLWRYLESKHVE